MWAPLPFLSELAAADRSGNAGRGGAGGRGGEDEVHGGELPQPFCPRLHAGAPGNRPIPGHWVEEWRRSWDCRADNMAISFSKLLSEITVSVLPEQLCCPQLVKEIKKPNKSVSLKQFLICGSFKAIHSYILWSGSFS